jgi:lipopolysaccharide biosynthesis protein
MEVPFQIELSTPPVRRIAAIIHVYYAELLPKIMGHLKNVPFETDLFISMDTTAKRNVILAMLRTYSNGTVEARVSENRGRDIAHFIVGYATFRMKLNELAGFRWAKILSDSSKATIWMYSD